MFRFVFLASRVVMKSTNEKSPFASLPRYSQNMFLQLIANDPIYANISEDFDTYTSEELADTYATVKTVRKYAFQVIGTKAATKFGLTSAKNFLHDRMKIELPQWIDFSKIQITMTPSEVDIILNKCENDKTNTHKSLFMEIGTSMFMDLFAGNVFKFIEESKTLNNILRKDRDRKVNDVAAATKQPQTEQWDINRDPLGLSKPQFDADNNETQEAYEKVTQLSPGRIWDRESSTPLEIIHSPTAGSDIFKKIQYMHEVEGRSPFSSIDASSSRAIKPTTSLVGSTRIGDNSILSTTDEDDVIGSVSYGSISDRRNVKNTSDDDDDMVENNFRQFSNSYESNSNASSRNSNDNNEDIDAENQFDEPVDDVNQRKKQYEKKLPREISYDRIDPMDFEMKIYHELENFEINDLKRERISYDENDSSNSNKKLRKDHVPFAEVARAKDNANSPPLRTQFIDLVKNEKQIEKTDFNVDNALSISIESNDKDVKNQSIENNLIINQNIVKVPILDTMSIGIFPHDNVIKTDNVDEIKDLLLQM